MATLREYFDTDVRELSLQAEWGTQDGAGTTTPPVIPKVVQDLAANSKHWRFFLPDGANPGSYTNMLLGLPLTERCMLSAEGDSVIIQSGLAGYSEQASSAALVFTRRIFLYIDALLSVADRRALAQLGAQRGFHVIVYDKEYATRRSELKKPLAFISYDTRDKDSLVRELAYEISRLMCPVRRRSTFTGWSTTARKRASTHPAVRGGRGGKMGCVGCVESTCLLHQGGRRNKGEAAFRPLGSVLRRDAPGR